MERINQLLSVYITYEYIEERRYIYRVSPKKIWFKLIFEFLTMGRVFLGVKNNSKNFGNKKNIRLFSKILSKWTLFYSKSSDLFNLYDFVHFKMSTNHSKSYNICYLYTCMHKYWLLNHLKKFSILDMAISS